MNEANIDQANINQANIDQAVMDQAVMDQENVDPEPFQKGQTTLQYNGYSYIKNNVYNNIANYRCSSYRNGCKATLKKNLGSGVITQNPLKSIHSCRRVVVVTAQVSDYKIEMKSHAKELAMTTHFSGKKIWKIVSEEAQKVNVDKSYHGLTDVN